jgi:tight adherence protein B
MTFLIVTAVFLAILLLTTAALWLARSIQQRLSPGEMEPIGQAPVPSFLEDEDAPLLLREAQLSSISPWAKLLEQFDFVERLNIVLAQSDLNCSIGRLTLGMLLSGTVALAILSGLSWIPFWAQMGASLVACLVPYVYVVKRKDKRLLQIEEQLPEAVEAMARALRAGYPFAAAIDTVGQQIPNPLGREFRKTFAEGALGLPWERALENFAGRLPLPEVCHFCAAVQVQSRSGGNLSEVLDKLAENMREAAAIRGEVRALSTQGRFAGRILTILPFAIAAVLLYVNPAYLAPLLHDPNGKTALLASGFALIAAHFVIRKMVDIKL